MFNKDDKGTNLVFEVKLASFRPAVTAPEFCNDYEGLIKLLKYSC